MAFVKVLRTTGTEEEIISKSEVAPNQIFITELSNKIVTDKHDMGDVLVDDHGKQRFALVVKHDIGDKINIPALRLAITNLLFELNSTGTIMDGLVISRHQFNNKKEETSFICSLGELSAILYSMGGNDAIKLIIADSKEED